MEQQPEIEAATLVLPAASTFIIPNYITKQPNVSLRLVEEQKITLTEKVFLIHDTAYL